MNEIFQQFGKQDQFKYIKKRLVNIDKSLLYFTVIQQNLWNTIRTRCLTRIKIGCHLISYLKVTRMLCFYGLVLEDRAGKDLPGSSRLDF